MVREVSLRDSHRSQRLYLLFPISTREVSLCGSRGLSRQTRLNPISPSALSRSRCVVREVSLRDSHRSKRIYFLFQIRTREVSLCGSRGLSRQTSLNPISHQHSRGLAAWFARSPFGIRAAVKRLDFLFPISTREVSLCGSRGLNAGFVQQ